MLLQRAFYESLRNKPYWLIRIGAGVLLGLLLGWTYSGQITGTEATTNRLGMIFFASMFIFIASAIAVLASFPLEKPIVGRELAAGRYSLSAYYVAKVLADLPFSLLTALFFGPCFYFITPLQVRPSSYPLVPAAHPLSYTSSSDMSLMTWLL